MRAFTLIEILLAIAIASILLGIGMVSLQSFRAQSDMHRGAQEVLSILQLARSKALASDGASHHGVFFAEGYGEPILILFQGNSYNERDEVKDVTYLLPSSLMFSDISFGEGEEVVFYRVAGRAVPKGFLSLQSRIRPLLEETITVSEEGVLSVDGLEGNLNEGRVTDSRHTHISYQGREIALTENIVLRFIDNELNEVEEKILIQDFLAGGQVAWEGEVEVGGELQYLIVRTHLFNEVGDTTVFSIHRDGSRNSAELTISLDGDETGSLVSYTQDGEIVMGISIYAQEPVGQ